MMSTNDLRSIDSTSARRRSALSNGGASRFTIRLVLLFIDVTWQATVGIWTLRSFRIGIVTSQGKVMSNLPEAKLSIAVARLGTMVNSMPSRYGLPFFQYSAFFATLMPSFCLNSTNLNGPVPIGLVRICATGTWQG